MKTCSRCNETKEYDYFAKKSVSKDGFATWCKECFKSYDRERYLAGDKARKDKNRSDRTKRVRDLLWEVLLNSECKVCGNSDPEVLEFDHRDPTDKSHNVSEMIRNYSWSAVQDEIQKCDILCANCHRKRTIKQFGFWRGNQISGL